jgi:hypothetical protein
MSYMDAVANSKEVKDTVLMWLNMQLKTFFADGIRKLTDQSNKCVSLSTDQLWGPPSLLCNGYQGLFPEG